MISNKNQTGQFILRDIVIFNKYKGGNLRQLVQKAIDAEHMKVEGATLILVNQKIRHKNSCIQH